MICPIQFRRGSILTPCSLTKIMVDPQRANFCINFQRLQFVSFMFFTMYFFSTELCFFFNIYFHLTMLSKFYHFNCYHLPNFVFQHNLESWCYCELIMHAKQNILLSRKQGKRTFNVKLLCSTEIISSGISSCSRHTDLTYISKPS